GPGHPQARRAPAEQQASQGGAAHCGGAPDAHPDRARLPEDRGGGLAEHGRTCGRRLTLLLERHAGREAIALTRYRTNTLAFEVKPPTGSCVGKCSARRCVESWSSTSSVPFGTSRFGSPLVQSGYQIRIATGPLPTVMRSE